MAHPPLHIVRRGRYSHHYRHPPLAIPNSLGIAPFADGNGRMSVVVGTFCRRRAQECNNCMTFEILYGDLSMWTQILNRKATC